MTATPFGVAATCAAIITATLAAATGLQAPPALETVTATVRADSALTESALDGCIRLHHLWKAQVLTLAEPADSREARLREAVFATNVPFWAGYLGDEAAFTKWVRSSKPLTDDPRFMVPTRLPLAATIVDTVRRMEQLAGRRACGEWFIVYGPGWTNMGGLGNGRMVLDVLGLSTTDPVADIRHNLPHELNHLIFDKGRADSERGTLLHRILDEGFASFVADEYWGPDFSSAQAVGYSPAEWEWAVRHEAVIWQQARSQLHSRERTVVDTFSSASRRIMDDAPGKVGYFLGYRIVDDFVQRNGPQSWRRLYDMPLADIVAATRFRP